MKSRTEAEDFIANRAMFRIVDGELECNFSKDLLRVFAESNCWENKIDESDYPVSSIFSQHFKENKIPGSWECSFSPQPNIVEGIISRLGLPRQNLINKQEVAKTFLRAEG